MFAAPKTFDRDLMMKRIALTCELPPEVIQEFAAAFDVLEMPLRGAKLRDRLAELDGCDAIVVAPPIVVDDAFLDVRPASVQIIGTYSVGSDHLDVPAARARGVKLLHTPDVLTDAVADCAVLLMLGATRRATESIDLIRAGRWTGWTPTQLVGLGLSGKTLGIFGMGRIARGVASRARAFGMSVQYYDSRDKPGSADDIAVRHTDLAEFLGSTDVLLLVSPLSAETRYFLDAAKLRLMKPTAVVVNVGRGDLIRDDDLIAALARGDIFAAGLDVFSNEPKVDPRYFDLPNVFMLPHIGSSTIETRLMMGRALITGLNALFAGADPVNRLT